MVEAIVILKNPHSSVNIRFSQNVPRFNAILNHISV